MAHSGGRTPSRAKRGRERAKAAGGARTRARAASQGSPRWAGGSEPLELAFAELESLGQAFEIYRRRRLAPDARPIGPRTAARFGLDLEQVAGHECEVEELIARRLRNPNWPLGVLARQVRSQVGPLARREELDQGLAAADPEGVVPGGAPHRLALVLHLAGEYTIRDGWVLDPVLDGRPPPGLLGKLGRLGPVDIAEARRALDAHGVRTELQRPWIESQGGYLIIDERLVPHRELDDGDRAAVELYRNGAPLGTDALFARVADRHTRRRPFESTLARDGRFVRTDWERHGLAEWGGEPFVDLRDAICLEIERHGGEMAIAELASILHSRYGVPSEAVHKARGYRCPVADDHGRIAWRPDPPFHPSLQPLATERDCFRLPLGWGLRVKVTAALARGAALTVPPAFADVLSPGMSTPSTTECRPGPLALSWRHSGPFAPLRFGGMRAATAAVGARPGDRLFLVIRPLGGLDLQLQGAERCERADGLERLALECGREPGVDPLVEVARALGIAPDLSRLGERVAERLAERGERDLLALLGDTLTREATREQRGGESERESDAAQGLGSGSGAGAAAGASIPVDWEALARAFANPLRISILEVMGIDGGRIMSPTDLSFELQVGLELVGNHVRALAAAGLIELRRTEPVRAVIEHFYGLVARDP